MPNRRRLIQRGAACAGIAANRVLGRIAAIHVPASRSMRHHNDEPPSAVGGTAGVATPTFTRDIAVIFQQKCECCHRPDAMAPMSLITYEEARPWARSIKTRVESRQMPPWSIDKTVGIQDFKNDRSLNDDQIA